MTRKKFKNRGLSVICFVLAISCAGELFVIVDGLNEKNELISYMGRIDRASLRYPPDMLSAYIDPGYQDDTEMIFDEMIERKIWEKLSYPERKEFVFHCLIIGDIEGGGLTMLGLLMDADITKISSELYSVSDEKLKKKFGWSDSDILSFRNKIHFLHGAGDNNGHN